MNQIKQQLQEELSLQNPFKNKMSWVKAKTLVMDV